MPEPAAVETAPPPATTPMKEIFERATDRVPVPPIPAKTEAAPPPVAEPKPEIPPPAEPQKPIPTVEDFVPPDVLLGEPEATPVKEPSVADLMPEEPPVAIRTEKGRADYKKWRQHQLSLETRVKEFQEKSKTQAPADANVMAENELLKQRLGEMSSVVERADLMSHPAFQNQFVKPRKQTFDAASELLREVDLNPNVLDKVLSLTGKARLEAQDELMGNVTSDSARIKLMGYIDKIEQFDQQQAAAMADIKGSSEQLQLQERANRHREVQENVKQLNGMVDMAVEHLRDKNGFEFLRKLDGNTKWNEGVVDQIVNEARELLTNTADPQQVAAAAVLAPMALRYRTAYVSEAKRRIAAERELAEYKGADPNLEGKVRADTGGGEELTGMEAIFKRAADGSVFGRS